MAKSSLLMRAATSGGGSSRLMMVLRRSFSSAWNAAINRELRCNLTWAYLCMCVRSHTGVTVSFFSAELYCSSERNGSPLGNVSSGDLVAISQTPSYHSSGHRPEGFNRSTSASGVLMMRHVSASLDEDRKCETNLSLRQQIPWLQSRAKSPGRASADVALLL